MIRTERQAIVVWFSHIKNIKQLKRFGHLIATSKRLHYAVIYVNLDDIENVIDKIERLSFVTKVERSYKRDVRMTYESKNLKKSKEYEYEMGI